jgi:threonine synthase
MVVLSTASPYKFPAAVLSALGVTPDENEFRSMDTLAEKTGVPIPKNLTGLETKAERHTCVIEKQNMLSFVTKI